MTFLCCAMRKSVSELCLKPRGYRIRLQEKKQNKKNEKKQKKQKKQRDEKEREN